MEEMKQQAACSPLEAVGTGILGDSHPKYKLLVLPNK
jgi:hypothetical protein